jgi:hypothetical protein
MGYDTKLSVSSTFSTPCSMAADEGITLSSYMQLPVDQYVCIKMPLDATLERLEGSRFNMTVPPVRFFNLDLSPTILCDVTQSATSVKIVSNECTLRGSPYVVGLNGCFKMNIVSEFKWTDVDNKRCISSASDIFIEVDPPPPFCFISNSILEKTGRIAMSIALAQIENAFVKALARDYERWAVDREYRVVRASGCEYPRAGDDNDVDADGVDGAGAGVNVGVGVDGGGMSISQGVSGGTGMLVGVDGDGDGDAELPVDQMDGIEADISVDTVVTKQSPPVLTDDICLLPGGDPIVRVEEAPTNSRRIFTGVDIMADMDSVWEVLTSYETLQNVVPSLVKNEVVERYPDGGARLAQVGGARVLPGVTFTAKTVLDVRVYREDSPIPETMLAAHLPDDAPSAAVREYDKALPLRRGIYPRPFSITSLPHRDITMQNVEGEGDFAHYQGVWRMQALPNCAPNGGDAARLTYAVEIKPKGLLPVRLIEGRIAADLKANMGAIRDFVEAKEERERAHLLVSAANRVRAGKAGAGKVVQSGKLVLEQLGATLSASLSGSKGGTETAGGGAGKGGQGGSTGGSMDVAVGTAGSGSGSGSVIGSGVGAGVGSASATASSLLEAITRGVLAAGPSDEQLAQQADAILAAAAAAAGAGAGAGAADDSSRLLSLDGTDQSSKSSGSEVSLSSLPSSPAAVAAAAAVTGTAGTAVAAPRQETSITGLYIRSNVRGALSSMFRRGDTSADPATSNTATDTTAGAVTGTGTGALVSSSGAGAGAGAGGDIAVENARLKDRVRLLEYEIERARGVIRRIGAAGDSD